MDSPPGCSSSEDDFGDDLDSSDFMNHTAPELGQSESDIIGGVLDRSNGAKRRRKPRRKKKNSFIDQNQTANLLLNIEKPSPQLNLPITKKEKKAYRSECVKRPKIDAPTNTNSYLCENNDSPSECVLEAHDLDDGGFSSEYQARLTEDYEGEKERTNHEENINKRHDYLKIRLDKANAELERLRPLEKDVESLRKRVTELEGEVMKLRSINRSQQRQRTLSSSDLLR